MTIKTEGGGDETVGAYANQTHARTKLYRPGESISGLSFFSRDLWVEPNFISILCENASHSLAYFTCPEIRTHELKTPEYCTLTQQAHYGAIKR